jgi:hypothetical protein
MTPLRIDLPYLVTDTDRYGNRRVYVRRHGQKIRLREKLGRPAFVEAYKAALAALGGMVDDRSRERSTAPVGSLDGSRCRISARQNSRHFIRSLRRRGA